MDRVFGVIVYSSGWPIVSRGEIARLAFVLASDEDSLST